MTKLGAIEFDDRILDALRDDRLVVFAGAGVSMGPPSNLASFWKLTSDIAQGTRFTPSEPLDRFLGQLHHSKVAVHERAAQLLSPARMHLHLTPTSSSWLNLVERWFRDLTDKRIRRESFDSVPDLIAVIEDYLMKSNQNPHIFVWTASVDRILAKFAKCKEALETLH